MFWDGLQWDENGQPTMKEDYVPVTTQMRLKAQEKIDEILAKLEEIYKKLYGGGPSEDGLYWYAYKRTTRSKGMQPDGYVAFDDDYTPTEQDLETHGISRSATDGEGAIGYDDPLHPDVAIKFGLIHVMSDEVYYQ